MTEPTAAPTDEEPEGDGDTRRRGGGTTNKIVLSILIALVIIVVFGGIVWFFLFRDDAPSSVNPDEAAQVAESIPGADKAQSGDFELTGAWEIVSTGDTETGSFVGYRVQEELATIGAKTAVGRTPDVSGTLEASGTDVTSVEVVADMTTVESDDSRRDGQMRSQALQTNEFPEATFVLIEPIALGEIPKEGTQVEATAKGELTIHGVTNEVDLPLTAEVVGGTIVVTGQIDIAFADYGISQPTSFAVLSVEDSGVIELQLFFEKTG